VKYLAIGLGVSTLLFLVILKFGFTSPATELAKANVHIGELIESVDRINKEVDDIGDDAPLSPRMAVRKRNIQDRTRVFETKAREIQKDLNPHTPVGRPEDGFLTRTTFVMLLSAALGCSAFYVILKSREAEDRNSAFGVLGALVGYWLR
jgi:hypothetical protein